MQILGKTNINFIKWRWHAIALSGVVLVAGLGQIMTQEGGMPLGVDFSGGSSMVLRFEEPVDEEAIRSALASVEGEKTVQQYGPEEDNAVIIRLPQTLTVEEGTTLDDAAQQVDDLIRDAGIGVFTREKTDLVGPAVGADLQRKGIYATLTALLGIMIYVGFRFRFTFAVGAVVATFHDVLITIVMLNWFGYELSLNIVAALLTMTGYSVNDTIVIFDRVRENSRTMRRDALGELINRSVNQTLSRTVVTSSTTFVTVLGLYLYGGEVLQGFAFTLLVGVLVGTYSSVFIAAAVAMLLSKPSPAVVAAANKKKKTKGRGKSA